MTEEEKRLLQKKLCKDASVIKYGTYSLGEGVTVDENYDPNAPADSSESDDASVSLDGVYMPPSSEDFIQNSIDAMVKEHDEQIAREKEEQDAKIAEIMNKFASNIQDNVSSLFDNT